MNALMLAALAVLLVALAVACGRRCGEWSIAAYGSIFVLVYVADALLTSTAEGLSLSPTLMHVPFGENARDAVVLSAALAMIVALAMVSAGSRLDRRSRDRLLARTQVSSVQLRPAMTFLPLALAVPFILRIRAAGNLSAYLANRQLYLNQSLLTTVAYNLLPAGAALAFFGAARASRPIRRIAWIGLTLLYVALCFLSGSRTTALLGAVAPLVHYGIVRYRTRPKSSTFGAATVSITLVFLALVAAEQYAAAYRGSDSSVGGSVFASQDISQFDASVDIYQLGLRYRQAYEAAFVSLVPRSVWSGKPVSGNAKASEMLYPSRYAATKAEIATSLIGEGFLVAGALGWLPAGLILGAWLTVLTRMRRRYGRLGVGGQVFGYLFLYRGINLIRGDLLDFVVPTVLTAIYLRASLQVRENGSESICGSATQRERQLA